MRAFLFFFLVLSLNPLLLMGWLSCQLRWGKSRVDFFFSPSSKRDRLLDMFKKTICLLSWPLLHLYLHIAQHRRLGLDTGVCFGTYKDTPPTLFWLTTSSVLVCRNRRKNSNLIEIENTHKVWNWPWNNNGKYRGEMHPSSNPHKAIVSDSLL